MATTDPAVAAAMRAWRAHPDSDLAEDWEFDYSGSEERIAAAREALAPVRELHRPWSIYGDDCDHAITEDPYTVGTIHPDGKHHYVTEIGWTCDHQYDVCSECCTDDTYQSEQCADYHDHGPGKPICATALLVYTSEELQ